MSVLSRKSLPFGRWPRIITLKRNVLEPASASTSTSLSLGSNSSITRLTSARTRDCRCPHPASISWSPSPNSGQLGAMPRSLLRTARRFSTTDSTRSHLVSGLSDPPIRNRRPRWGLLLRSALCESATIRYSRLASVESRALEQRRASPPLVDCYFQYQDSDSQVLEVETATTRETSVGLQVSRPRWPVPESSRRTLSGRYCCLHPWRFLLPRRHRTEDAGR